MNESQIFIRDAGLAFDNAIAGSLFSLDPSSPDYVGHWQYMYSTNAHREHLDWFKHGGSREYLTCVFNVDQMCGVL